MPTARKKKIVFILPHLNAGGAERVLITLMNNLPRSDYDVHFISLSSGGQARDWLADDITVFELKKGGVGKGLYALYKTLKNLRPDAVVTTMTHSNGGLLLLKRFFRGVKFVVRESSLPSALMRNYGAKGRLFRYIYKYLYPLADVVLCPARIIIEEIKSMGFRTSNCRLLFNPVDEARILTGIKPDQKDESATLQFVCVGRLTFEKGYERLITALSSFNPGFEWTLNIVGGGRSGSTLQDLIDRQGLADRVFLLGHQDNPWQWMRDSDCLLLPSLFEGMPNVVLESLVCGTPVIGHADAGGIADIALFSQDVSVATNMEEFMELMSGVQKKTEKGCSRLPEAFKLDRVISEFTGLIHDAE